MRHFHSQVLTRLVHFFDEVLQAGYIFESVEQLDERVGLTVGEISIDHIDQFHALVFICRHSAQVLHLAVVQDTLRAQLPHDVVETSRVALFDELKLNLLELVPRQVFVVCTF